MRATYKKILVQRADRLGDVVLSLPVVEALKSKYPNAEIHFLTSPLGAEFVEGHPLIAKIKTINLTGPGVFGQWRNLAADIRRERYDLYVSLWNNPWMAWLGFWADIPTRIGDATNASLSWLYSKTVRQRWEDFTRHQIEFNLDLLRPLGIKSAHVKAKIPADEKAEKVVARWLSSHSSSHRQKVFIFTATGGTNHPIPQVAILAFVNHLLKTEKYFVVLAGPHNALDDFSAPHVLNVIGKTTMKELVAAIRACDFYVGPDTGPTHIASFLEKPMLFFSPIKPNPPSRWGPYSPSVEIIRKEYACSHAYLEKCRPEMCFDFLNGDYLFEKFNELLAKLNEPLSPAKRRDYLLLNSLRVLYVLKKESDRIRAANYIEKLTAKGLVVFVAPLRFRAIVELVGLRNINVLQGKIPRWMVWSIQFYVGAVKKYIRPVFTRQSLHDHIKVADYLRIYEKKWQRRAR